MCEITTVYIIVTIFDFTYRYDKERRGEILELHNIEVSFQDLGIQLMNRDGSYKLVNEVIGNLVSVWNEIGRDRKLAIVNKIVD